MRKIVMQTDYIVVGAGSAGCVVASRLSEHGAQVVLLEAGPRDWNPMIHVPAGTIKVIGHPVIDWNYRTESEAQASNRSIRLPRGRVLGGSSAINGMIFVRGYPADFDGWVQLGCRGWGYDDVLPFFKSMERYGGGDERYRGRSGMLSVQGARTILPVTHHFVQAAQQAGFPLMADINGGVSGDSVSYSQVSQKGRFRASAATAFLGPARRRPNLRIETEALVTKLLFEGKRCTGVAFRQNGKDRQEFAARDVVLCGGAINSPHLLQISGIGPGEHLRSIGVEVVHELPGVGNNLSDHYAAPVAARVKGLKTVNDIRRGPRLAWEAVRWVLTGRGAFSFGVTTASVFCRSREGLASPDLQLLFFPGSINQSRVGESRSTNAILEKEPGMRISVSVARPESRGTIMARSASPFEAPVIRPHYLVAPNDLRGMTAGIGQARRIFASRALAPYITKETMPGSDIRSEADIESYVRSTGSTVHHPVGTCKMGDDHMAAVDPRLRVRGIGGLRVIDASIMPTITTGNTNAPTIMIGEKGAAMILEDAAKA